MRSKLNSAHTHIFMYSHIHRFTPSHLTCSMSIFSCTAGQHGLGMNATYLISLNFTTAACCLVWSGSLCSILTKWMLTNKLGIRNVIWLHYSEHLSLSSFTDKGFGRWVQRTFAIAKDNGCGHLANIHAICRLAMILYFSVILTLDRTGLDWNHPINLRKKKKGFLSVSGVCLAHEIQLQKLMPCKWKRKEWNAWVCHWKLVRGIYIQDKKMLLQSKWHNIIFFLHLVLSHCFCWFTEVWSILCSNMQFSKNIMHARTYYKTPSRCQHF